LIADVIKLNAQVEQSLDLYLAIQFGGPGRIDVFVELIAPRLTLSNKIDVLKKMKFHRLMKSHTNIVHVAERVNRLRNKLAHVARPASDDMRKTQSDKWLSEFVLGYPQTLRAEKRRLDKSFSHLLRSWEVRWKKSRKTQ
jgi:hypothetical protein